MSDQRLRELGVRIEDATPMHDFDDLVGRARRRVAARRAGALTAVLAASAAVAFGVVQVGDQDQTSPPPADRAVHDRAMWCPTDRSPDCVDISGWIAYGHNGIWAVDPSRPDDSDHAIQLSGQRRVDPLEWSSDGTKLLVRSWGQDGRLSVLHADGSETLVADGGYFDGSFSPDGSQVIYTSYVGGMGIVDSEGGTPRRLLDPDDDLVYAPAFSPDGEQIAYFTGGGDHSHTLRVMSSDGTDGRTLLFRRGGASHINDLDWAPDGRHLMFAFNEGEGGIWTLRVDGSGLTQVAPDGVNPAWSPDGTRISYQEAGQMRIADADGTHVTEPGYGGSGPWNPLPLDR
jgi:Tol biopolymer transport system component